MDMPVALAMVGSVTSARPGRTCSRNHCSSNSSRRTPRLGVRLPKPAVRPAELGWPFGGGQPPRLCGSAGRPPAAGTPQPRRRRLAVPTWPTPSVGWPGRMGSRWHEAGPDRSRPEREPHRFSTPVPVGGPGREPTAAGGPSCEAALPPIPDPGHRPSPDCRISGWPPGGAWSGSALPVTTPCRARSSRASGRRGPRRQAG